MIPRKAPLIWGQKNEGKLTEKQKVKLVQLFHCCRWMELGYTGDLLWERKNVKGHLIPNAFINCATMLCVMWFCCLLFAAFK